MWGSTIPCVYYGFFCTPSLQRIYYALDSILAILCVHATLNSSFRDPKYRPYRTAMYSGLGLSFLIPIIHGLIKFGWDTQMWRMSLDWMLLMTTTNLTGGALYAMRVRSTIQILEKLEDLLSIDSRKVVSDSIRHCWSEPSDYALSCYMCWYCTSFWSIEGF